MYSVMPQHFPQNFSWGSSTSSCSEMEDNDSELSYETKEEDQFSFLDEMIKINPQNCPTVPPLAPCSEATASLSSAFTKRDKVSRRKISLFLQIYCRMSIRHKHLC